MSLSHDKLIDFVKQLKYPIDSNGMCYGLSVMAMQAILANDFDTFNRRLNAMASISTDEFAERVEEIEQKRMAFIKGHKDALLKTLDLSPAIDDITFYKELEKHKNDLEVKNYHLSRNNINENKAFTEAERDLIDVRGFLEKVALYHAPEKFLQLFEKDARIVGQHADLIFSLGLPFNLAVEKVSASTGLYTLEKLTDLFKLLCPAQPGFKPPAALLLSSSDHAITVSYDSEKQCWLIINTYDLSKRECKTESEIAKEVLTAFSENSVAVFNTEIYCTKAQAQQIETWFSEVSKSPAWLTLHDAKGAENESDSCGASLLLVAAQHGDIAVAKELLTLEVDVDKERFDGSTPLGMAAQNGYVDVVNALLETKKINPSKANDNGSTPLMMAAQDGHIEIVLALLKAGADPNILNAKGKTALFTAALNGHVKVVEQLLLGKAEPNKVDSFGTTPLSMAAYGGHLAVLDKLIEYKAILDVSSPMSMVTLLNVALQKNRTDQIKKLFQDKKIDESQRVDGFTPFHIAIYFGHTSIVKSLIAAGCDIHKKTEGNISALELALAMGHADVVEILQNKLRVEQEAKVSVKTEAGVKVEAKVEATKVKDTAESRYSLFAALSSFFTSSSDKEKPKKQTKGK